MSDQTTPEPIPAASPSVQKRMTDNAVATSRSLPDLVSKLKVVDPDLASQIIGKSLLAAKSPWGTLLAAGVSYVASKYALGWDETTCDVVAGIGVIVGAYAMRWITKAPIVSVLPQSEPTTPGGLP